MRETNTENVTQAECAFPLRSDGDLGCGSNPCPGQHQLPLRSEFRALCRRCRDL